MKKISLACVSAFLLAAFWLAPARGAAIGEIFSQTNWNSLAAGIYGNYIFYKTEMERPNIGYFLQAMRECAQKLEDCLEGKGPEWEGEAVTRFKNLVALGQVALFEMNRFAATVNFTNEALDVDGILRAAFRDMREKGLFSTSETAFMLRFRNLEESDVVGDTCRSIVVTRTFREPGSTLQQEYMKYNNNVQHLLLSAKSGAQTCAWVGNCIREAGNRIKCQGVLGSQGSLEGSMANGRLVILNQTVDAQCGFSALAGVYEEKPLNTAE